MRDCLSFDPSSYCTDSSNPFNYYQDSSNHLNSNTSLFYRWSNSQQKVRNQQQKLENSLFNKNQYNSSTHISTPNQFGFQLYPRSGFYRFNSDSLSFYSSILSQYSNNIPSQFNTYSHSQGHPPVIFPDYNKVILPHIQPSWSYSYPHFSSNQFSFDSPPPWTKTSYSQPPENQQQTKPYYSHKANCDPIDFPLYYRRSFQQLRAPILSPRKIPVRKHNIMAPTSPNQRYPHAFTPSSSSLSESDSSTSNHSKRDKIRRRHHRLTRLRSTSVTNIPYAHENADTWADSHSSQINHEKGSNETPELSASNNVRSFLFWKRRKSLLPPGIRGFENLGNTCYMNSALQCLVATRLFSEYFYRSMYLKDVAQKQYKESYGQLSAAFGDLVRQLRLQKSSTSSQPGLNLSVLKHVISRVNPLFKGFQQHDAQEFLALFLDGIHEELNRANPKFEIHDPDINTYELSKQRFEVLAASAWQRYLCRNKSFLVDLFQGQLESRITCRRCYEVSVKFEPFMYLSVPVSIPPNIRINSLIRALEAFSSPEQLTEPCWSCPRCKMKVPVNKTLTLVKLPPVLIIHLKRFEYTSNSFRKVEGRVSAPLVGLDMENIVKQKAPPVYDLYGVVDHSGQAEYGHYAASCIRDGTWYRFDDAIVSEIDPKYVINENNCKKWLDVPLQPELLRRQTLQKPEDWPHTLRSRSIEEIRRQEGQLVGRRSQRIYS